MLLIYSLLVATLSAVANAGCSDGTIDGVDVASGPFAGEFFYPLNDTLLTFVIAIGSIKYESDGVNPAVGDTEEYRAREDDGNDYGNSFTISNVYPGQETDFKLLCEEMWACSAFYQQYLDKSSDDFDYETKALCFDRIYYIDSTDDVSELRYRENYIVETCWGGQIDENFYNTIANLTATRNALCAETEELVDRLKFNVSDLPEDERIECRRAINCIKESTNDIIQKLKDSGFINENTLNKALRGKDMDEIYGDTGDVAFEVCFGKNVTEIAATADDCETKVTAAGPCPSITYTEGKIRQCGESPNQGALPQCPLSIAEQFRDFGPAYPTNEPGYVLATASIRDLFIPCDLDRTSADAVGVILFLKPIFDGILIFAVQLRDAFPKDFPYIPFVLVALIPRIIVLALKIVLEQAKFHDGLIQVAEIEALYENTRQMLNASAAIYDEVVCRCIHDLETRPQKGHGCDSIDNNCDDIVDDCEEDYWHPEISIGSALSQCSQTWFNTSEEALDCVKSQVKVADDCDEFLTEPDFTLSGTCFTSQFTMSAADKCGNSATNRTVPVLIDDGLPPSVSCFVDDGSGAGTLAAYFSTGANILEDVMLTYEASDACNGDVEVDVAVYSNEIEDFQSQKMALLFQNDNLNDAAGLYIAKGICSTDSNGQCIKDPKNEDIRLYTVVVSATDLSGLTASTECQVVIIPKNTTVADFDLTASTQRFFLASYESTFAGTAP